MDIFKGGYIFYFLGKKNMYECLYRMYGMAQWFFWIRYICFTDFNKASSFQFSLLNWMIPILFVMLVTSSWLDSNQQVVIVTALI